MRNGLDAKYSEISFRSGCRRDPQFSLRYQKRPALNKIKRIIESESTKFSEIQVHTIRFPITI